MPDMPLVTVIIPCFNSEQFIAAAIDSVQSQTYRNVDLLIIDDGSSDRSLEIASSRLNDSTRILTHPGHENLGVSLSRKLGVENARGQFIAFLDADDCFDKSKLQKQVDAMVANPDSVLCHTGITQINEMPTDRDFAAWFNFSKEELVYSLENAPFFLQSNQICNSTVLIRADIVRPLLFSLRLVFQFEDWILWTLASEKGKFIFLPESLICYRYHEKSATHAVIQNPLRMLYSHIELYLVLIQKIQSASARQKCIVLLAEKLAKLIEEYRIPDSILPEQALMGELGESLINSLNRYYGLTV